MGNKVVLNIKDSSKLAFFLELIKNFEFITVSKIIPDKATNNKEALKEIEQAVKELNLAKKGKLKTRSAKLLLDELQG